MNYKKIIQTIKKHKTFLISAHVNPDPDALCSEIALAIYLRSLGKTADIVNEEAIPGRFKFLPHSNWVKRYSDKKHASYDVAIILDCGDLSRVGKVQKLISPQTIVINIDHHITNDYFGRIHCVVHKASSTAEILFELLSAAKFKLTDNAAMHLYTGIMTDTGSFRYENTSPRTFEIAAQLKRYGFSADKIYRQIYESIPANDIKEFTKIIKQFHSEFDGRAAYVYLQKDVLSKFSQEFDLRDTIFKFLRAIKGVDVIVIFTEVAKNKTRINFRSFGKVDVAKIAHSFNGGGHKNASGGLIAKNMKDAQKVVLKAIKKVL